MLQGETGFSTIEKTRKLGTYKSQKDMCMLFKNTGTVTKKA